MTDEETQLALSREQVKNAMARLAALREIIGELASKCGKLEQQRNHARWKYGLAKRRWRAERERHRQAAASDLATIERLRHIIEVRGTRIAELEASHRAQSLESKEAM